MLKYFVFVLKSVKKRPWSQAIIMESREGSGINTSSLLSAGCNLYPFNRSLFCHMLVPKSIRTAERADDVGDLEGILVVGIDQFCRKCTRFSSMINPSEMNFTLWYSCFFKALQLDCSVDNVARRQVRSSGVRFPSGTTYILLFKMSATYQPPSGYSFHHQDKAAGK